jgi:hypothetical protein
MPNNDQIKLIQTAARAAGLRNGKQDGRYRMVLAQYRVKSSKDMTNAQIDDFLAICEALGWRYPGKPETYFRSRAAASADGRMASWAQLEAIGHLSGDLGFQGGDISMAKFISRMTCGRVDAKEQLTLDEAWTIISSLKAMLQRRDGVKYKNCTDIKTTYTEVKEHGKEAVNTCPI